MEDQSDDWAEYARIQSQLSKCATSTDRQWGLEHAADQILTAIEQGQPCELASTKRYVETGARRQRYRASILRLHQDTITPINPAPETALEARSEVIYLSSRDPEIKLVQRVVEGHSYRELAQAFAATESSLRKRASRCRQRLAEALAA